MVGNRTFTSATLTRPIITVYKKPAFWITVYKSLRDGKWRWRLRSRNGRTVADSGEGYSGHKRCVVIVERIFGERWPVEVMEGNG